MAALIPDTHPVSDFGCSGPNTEGNKGCSGYNEPDPGKQMIEFSLFSNSRVFNDDHEKSGRSGYN